MSMSMSMYVYEEHKSNTNNNAEQKWFTIKGRLIISSSATTYNIKS